eukprot:SAG11_NODE_3993_length_2118_cov_2.908866_4_plen_95_part_00
MLAGAAVMYSSKKFKHVASNGSSSVVEYFESNAAAQSAMSIRNLLLDLGDGAEDLVREPTPLYGDNTSVWRWAMLDLISSANLPIRNVYHYVNE